MQDPEKLKKSWEFQRAYQKGSKYWNRYFVIYVLQNHFNHLRLGITVSKKVGKSVQRNRVKRLIRESFRQLRTQINVGYDIVVVGRTPACRLTCQETQNTLAHLFQKAAILNRHSRNRKHWWSVLPNEWYRTTLIVKFENITLSAKLFFSRTATETEKMLTIPRK